MNKLPNHHKSRLSDHLATGPSDHSTTGPSDHSTTYTLNHKPVLYKEVLKNIYSNDDKTYIDCTLNGGGFAYYFLSQKQTFTGTYVGIDIDINAIKKSEDRLSEYRDRLILVNDNYINIDLIADCKKLKSVAGIIFDLGISLNQLKESGLGLSYKTDDILDMNYTDKDSDRTTVADFLNTTDKKELSKILKEYGDIRYSNKIANAIVADRVQTGKYEKVSDLINVLDKEVYQHKRNDIYPRIFQALRIHINREYDNIKTAILKAIDILEPGGRLAVISFHSGEDRIVKRIFKYESRDCICPPTFPECCCEKVKRLNIISKVITPTSEEIGNNFLSRSAKLRVAEKV